MYRTRQQFPSFMGVYIPPCGDVQSSVNICICDIATVCTAKVLATANTDVSALVAGLRGVCRRNGDNLNASQLALVFEERAELMEIPRVASPAERLVALLGVHAPADILQVLNGYALVIFLCLRYELLAYAVVHNGGKSSLTSFQPFQQLMTVAGAFGLNRSSHFVVPISYILDLIGGDIHAIGNGNNVRDTHIYTHEVLRALFFLVGNVYRLIEVEFPLDKNEVGFSLCELHELRTVAGICYLFTPTDKRNGTDGLGSVVGEHTAVISDSPELTEVSLLLPVKFVCVRNLADCTYNELRRKVVCFLNRIVNLLVQTELLEHTAFPRYLRDSVASLVEYAECLFQHLDLYVRWKQFNLQGQFHTTKIRKTTELFKHLKKTIILSLTKEGIVAHFLPEAEDFRVSLSRVL